MLRSLGFKLTFGFIAVSLVATFLVVTIVRNSTFLGFDQFLLAANAEQGPPPGQQPPPPPNNRQGSNDGRRFEADTAAGNFEDVINASLFWGALGGTLLATAVGILMARQLIQPIKTLTVASQKLSDGELGYQVSVDAQDEIGDLARSFNQMSSELERSNHLRRQMTADIAHDIRTPLTVIAGYTEGLSEEKLSPSVATFQVMHAQVCLLQHLLDDLHTLSLSDGGDLVLQKQRVDPRALLERTAVTYLQQAEAQNITLRVNAPSDLPLVNVDIERMVQVFNNLVGNALRYTSAGGEIALEANEQAGRVVLRVCDTGAGIPAADLPNIFERFYRADHARQRTDTQSSGLGLAIAKAIVEAHGGRISVTSQPNVGTTFTILMN